MKITILGAGTGTSGLPHTKNSDYPPGFLVEWADQKMLFECSEGVRFRLQQAGFKYADLHHIAISHPHPDHNAFLHFLQAVYLYGEWGGVKNTEMNLYAPKYLIENLPKLWDLHFQGVSIGKQRFFSFSSLKTHAMPNSDIIKIHNGTLTAEKVYHEQGASDALAYRLETPEGIFAYSGDTGDCEGIKTVAKGADIFVCEATARIGDEASATAWGHINPKQAGEIAREAGAKKLVLFHYTGLDPDQAMIEDCESSGFAGEIIIGKDFQTLEI